ncbi:hypothetical protein BgiMline_003075 [Biomphalaria glabrata]|uniref:Uncharacterized protein LOC106061047 n=1 Tax=Biomphalaria glabrata TaxID=6526 RepID=A0A9U8E6X6_BIOGL|nr:uncharacterized protein LOC106061047 [Biomphalaria glabrata]KAI8755558.1 hypothetical protein BgiMline_011648 [Biomphalaria glabrata]
MLQSSLIALVLVEFIHQIAADDYTQTFPLNSPVTGSYYSPAGNAYFQNSYGSPYGYGRFAPFGSSYANSASPYGDAYANYGNGLNPYGYTYAPYGNSPTSYNNAYAPYGSFPSSFDNGISDYLNPLASVPGALASTGNGLLGYLSKYGYDNKYYSPIVLGHDFGAGAQVGYPGMPGSYRIRLNGALVAESTAPGTPGAYSALSSMSGNKPKGYSGSNFVFKKKK